MTLNLLRVAMCAGVLMTGAAATASAQKLKGTVSFPFSASGKVMPAGEYSLLRSDPYVWEVRNIRERKSIVAIGPTTAQTRKPSEAQQSVLVFRCVGGECALQRLYVAGEVRGYEFPTKSRPADPGVNISYVRVVLAD